MSLSFPERCFRSAIAAFFIYILASFCNFIWMIHPNPNFRSLLSTNAFIELVGPSFRIGGTLILALPLLWITTWLAGKFGMSISKSLSTLSFSVLFLIVTSVVMTLIFWPANVETYLDQTLGDAVQDRRIHFDFLISLKVILEKDGIYLALASIGFGSAFATFNRKSLN